MKDDDDALPSPIQEENGNYPVENDEVSWTEFILGLLITIVTRISWFKALAKRTRKSTFGHPLASSCIDLRRLAWTCVDFGRAQIWTQVDASFLPFGHPAQFDTSWPQVICCYRNALTNDMTNPHESRRVSHIKNKGLEQTGESMQMSSNNE